MDKTRLDRALVERGLAMSRVRAQSAIRGGRVRVDGTAVLKASLPVHPGQELTVEPEETEYVSRGGFKLAKALDVFGIPVDGLIAADIGASTGGFTDCLLRAGIRRVFAIDVGEAQLVAPLRSDPRVVCMEHMNFRFFTAFTLPEPVDFACVDVSFISLTLLLEPLAAVLKADGQAVCLVKPQFEARRGGTDRRGVVRDAGRHREVLESVSQAAVSAGFFCAGLTFSPIRGGSGNIEFLLHLHLQHGDAGTPLPAEMIRAVVSDAHRQLSREPIA